jgi:predicted transcriptional regulator
MSDIIAASYFIRVLVMSMATIRASRAQKSSRVGDQSRLPVEAWAEHDDDADVIVVDRSGVVRWRRLASGNVEP